MGSLRRQSLIYTAITLIGIMVISIAASRFWVDLSLRDFEERDAEQTHNRINILLDLQLASMRKQAADYSVWNTTYEYMANPDPFYISQNYSRPILENLDIDQAYLIRSNGDIVVAIYRAEQIVLGATGIRYMAGAKHTDLTRKILAIRSKRHGAKMAGFFSLNGKHYMYGISAILDNEGKGITPGDVVFIRHLDQKRMDVLHRLAQVKFDLSIPAIPEKIAINDNNITSISTLRSADGKALASTTVNQARPLIEMVNTTSKLISANSILLTIIALLVVYILFDRLVLRKIDALVRNIFSVRNVGSIDSRLPVIGNQDIDRISTEVNFMLSDLTDSHVRLRHEAMHDHLTGLGNRKLLLQELEAAAAGVRAGTHRRALVLLMDLDAFKDINDVHGHLAGDAVLIEIAKRLSKCAGDTHTAIRIGGDEFACVIHDLGNNAPESFPQHMLEIVQQPIAFEGLLLHVQASIGVVLIDTENNFDQPPIELLRKADIAMYASKQKAKNSFLLFDKSIEKSVSERKRLELDLAAMIAMQSFDLRLQPIVRSMDGKTFVIEVLARWQHPELGNISPSLFIAMAESTNLMARLDRAVIQRSCALLAELRQEFSELRFSINISATTLVSPGITEFIKASLAEHKLPRNALLLEITESMLASDERDLVEALQSILGLGVQFMIDDFGTGYSSLSRLNELPLDYIKIDRSFLSNLERTGNPMCQAIIQLAHSLGMKVVAEGVETPAQQRLLTELGCDYLQGFHLAAPMSMHQLSAYLRLH